MNGYFRDFRIPIQLQTFEELKQICKENRLKLTIPYSSQSEITKLIKLKRQRDEQEIVENELKIKRLKTSPSSSSSDEENRDYNNKILSNDNSIEIVKEIDKDDEKTDQIKNNIIIQNLENRLFLEKAISFQFQLNDYAMALNKKLVKFNNTPIFVQNEVDYELPPKFNYVNEYDLKNLDEDTINTIKLSVQACDCKNNCKSESLTKLCCFNKYAESGDQRCFYNSAGLIKRGVIKRGPIIECTDSCECNEECSNRVIQKGNKVKMAIFKTRDGRGWGLKSLEEIPKNKFICTYSGEIITSEEALKRQQEYSDKFFFDLDYNENLDFKYVVDATNTSSLGRFLNHSCSANCETFIAYVSHCYILMPCIAFFTNRLIKAHEELTIDYFQGNDYQLPAEAIKKRIDCRCGSSKCKRYYFH